MAYNAATESLSPASLNGFRFFVRSERIAEQGRRIILHEYLNSNRIFAEDIGEIPPKFSIDAFVHSDRTALRVGADNQVRTFRNIDYLRRAQEFRNLLNRQLNKSAKLVLPSFGSFRVTVLSYGESVSHTGIGEVKFDLNFVRSSPSQTEITAPSQITDNYRRSDEARVQVQNTSVTFWERVVQNITNINNRLALLHDITTMSTDISNRVRNFIGAGPLGELRSSIRNFITSLPNLVNLPERLMGNLVSTYEDDIGMFQNLSNRLSETNSRNSYVLARDFTYSGSGLFNDMSSIRREIPNIENNTVIGSYNKPVWNPTTFQRIQRNNARNIILDIFRINWLLIALEQAAAREYNTSEEVETVRSELNTVYNQVVLEASKNVDSPLSDLDVLDSINTVRFTTFQILDRKEQQAFNLTTINYLGQIDVINLTYALYAEELTNYQQLMERASLISQLNPEQRPDTMTGELTILQSRE